MKVFLDIDKIEKFPITFIVKSEEKIETIKSKIQSKAEKIYPIKKIIAKYMVGQRKLSQ